MDKLLKNVSDFIKSTYEGERDADMAMYLIKKLDTLTAEVSNITSKYHKLTEKLTEIILYDLPKISLNEWYSGNHWNNRKKIKDIYKIIVKNQFKEVLSDKNKYTAKYVFTFCKRPLDATNCVAMVKMIEDIIFKNDSYKIVKEISIESRKGLTDSVFIIINEIL